MGLDYSVKNSRKNGKKLRPSNKNSEVHFLRELFKDGKSLPSFFREFSVRQKKLVLDVYSRTDGIRYKNCIQISTSKDSEAKLIQEIAVTSGNACTLSPKIVDGKVYYNLTVTLDKPYRYVCNKNLIKTKYEGYVWCLSVDNDTLMVRRNGKVGITGNSPQKTGSVNYVGSLVQHKFNHWDLKKVSGVLHFDLNNGKIKRTKNILSKHYMKYDFDVTNTVPDVNPNQVLLQVFSEKSKDDISQIMENYDYIYVRKFNDLQITKNEYVGFNVEKPKTILRDYIKNNRPEALNNFDEVMRNSNET